MAEKEKDIVQDLREGIDWNPDDIPRAEKLMDDAADEIERLRRALENVAHDDACDHQDEARAALRLDV